MQLVLFVYMCAHRVQAALGNYMAWLAPKAQLVPAVDPDNLHPDKAVVSWRQGVVVVVGSGDGQGHTVERGAKQLCRTSSSSSLPPSRCSHSITQLSFSVVLLLLSLLLLCYTNTGAKLQG